MPIDRRVRPRRRACANGTAEPRAEAEALALAHAGAASPLTEGAEPAAVVPAQGGHDGRLGADGG